MASTPLILGRKQTATVVLLLMLLVSGATCLRRQATTAMLSCSPTELTQDSILELRFQMPHPQELSISGPDGTSFFVVWQRTGYDPPGLLPLMTREEFLRESKLVLPVRTFKASPWTAGRDENERVFAIPGTYQVRLTEILETEDLPVYTCGVRFNPR